MADHDKFIKREKMTPPQEKFVLEYLKTGNAAQAYRVAYPNDKHIKDSNQSYVYSRARDVLKTKAVQGYLSDPNKRLGNSHSIADASEILEFYTKVMRGQVKDYGILQGVGAIEVDTSIKDRLTAGKELLKRYPTSATETAKLRKTKAEAEVAELKARALREMNTDSNSTLVQLLKEVKGGVLDDSTSDTDEEAT